MKVLLIGANGQVGKRIVRLLKDSNDHTLRAMVRSEEQAEALKNSGMEAVISNLEGSVEEIAEAIKGSDAVIFTAGSGSKTGPDKTLLVDLDGAVKSMEAAEMAGAKRYVMVSAFQAHNRDSWKDSPIKPYMVVKHYADRILMTTDLNYTIVRPGGLINENGTGRVAAAENLDRGTISREDVARTVVASLTEENTYKRSFDLMSGDSTVEEALKNL
ncbi:SDR family oxidoreductase [Oceanobacillus salinisoli]|uniref:SDR family oxidoreductase n=1 Tax=Oceanobacillus salinisoli TaxID=2678611 RepID=UPI0012E13A95|nr:SDR family oxidoreductase [Oceanobacillus salinisoli]